MSGVAQTWFLWMAAMSLQVAVLILFVAMLDRLLRDLAWPQLRHALWLPVDMEPRDVECAVLHEAAHVKRGDLWTQALFGLLHLLYSNGKRLRRKDPRQ